MTRASLCRAQREGPSKALRQTEHVRHHSPHRDLSRRADQITQYSIPCSSSGCHIVGTDCEPDTRHRDTTKSHPTNDCSGHGPGPLHAAHWKSARDFQDILLRPWLGLLGLLPTEYHSPTPAPHRERHQLILHLNLRKYIKATFASVPAGLDHLQSAQPSHAIPHLYLLAIVRALAYFVQSRSPTTYSPSL